MPSRRTLLAGIGAAATALAGCAATADDPPKSGRDAPLNTDKHVYGADGEWSSFGCNASNTRAVADGKAPTDGVTERWRVEVNQFTSREPVVAGGRVYQAVHDELRVYDAADGAKLWSKAGVREPPLVRDGTVYVGARHRLLALDPETGEAKWERAFDGNGLVRSPATYNGDWLYAPVGETIHRIDPETGETDWSRRLFGELLGSPPIYSGYYVALATEAGSSTCSNPTAPARASGTCRRRHSRRRPRTPTASTSTASTGRRTVSSSRTNRAEASTGRSTPAGRTADSP